MKSIEIMEDMAQKNYKNITTKVYAFLHYFNMKHLCEDLLEATDDIWDYFSGKINFIQGNIHQ